MATRPTLPYYAPAALLPGPLPTLKEIRESKERVSTEDQTTVVRIRGYYAVKYGRRTTMQEGENQLFVQQATSIPVPTVYAIYQDEVDGYKLSFIVMEYVPGKTLQSAWSTLDASQKREISSQLRRHMSEWHSIPSPGYYGGIWRQPIRDSDFESRTVGNQSYSEPEISGPHETEEQWVDGMWRILYKIEGDNEISAGRHRYLALLRHHYHTVFKGHGSVFTHGNLCRVNILLREDGTIVIIDWEHAGWYPSFWEYCGSMMLVYHVDDWGDYLVQALDGYSAELGWFSRHREMIQFS